MNSEELIQRDLGQDDCCECDYGFCLMTCDGGHAEVELQRCDTCQQLQGDVDAQAKFMRLAEWFAPDLLDALYRAVMSKAKERDS